ncbi:MAG: type II secretion system ATPase GspE [Deltaproteobacteria bacterium]|nr:type II secretion system ATPase GspE [Deltaproteobacteria bacterium]
MEDSYVGEVLLRRGAVSEEHLRKAVEVAREKNARLKDVLVATDVIEENTLIKVLADELGFEFIAKIKVDEVPNELVKRVPINFARQNQLLPIAQHDHTVVVAFADVLDLSPLDDLRALLGSPCEAVVAPADVIEDAINLVYERHDENALADAKEGEETEELQDLIDMTDEAPVIRWVNNLFYEAVRSRASDIHIEPTDTDVVVRYRIDGTLYKIKTAHRGFLKSIVSRVKIEAGLNIAETRLPQDGRITKKIKGKLVDVRVSTIPTARGERIVLRLLDKEQALLDLPQLGFNPAKLAHIESLIAKPNGIILVTGPTGSGKTTTLYACLNKINSPELNIMTVEDPVEYELKGISQMHVKPKIGLTFASGLRSFLRQDPDVIMVGEIRDRETAEIAIHASLTGHLVLSTLHTNDAAGAITRLVEMGIQPYLITSTLLAVLAQRLVRKLCTVCRQPYVPTQDEITSLEINGARNPASTFASERNATISQGPRPDEGDTGLIFYRPVGCDACAGTGYRGRTGIYELLIIDEPIRYEILNSSDSNRITRVARERGLSILREDGARQVVQGITSPEEVLAATQAGELE